MSNLLIGLFLGILLGLAIPPFYKWIVKKVTKPSDVVNTISGFILLSVLTGCGKFHGTNQSVWSEGMWVVPVLLFGAAGVFGLFAFKAITSGSEQQGQRGTIYSDKKVSVWKVPQFWFAVAFTMAAIGVIIWQNAEK